MREAGRNMICIFCLRQLANRKTCRETSGRWLRRSCVNLDNMLQSRPLSLKPCGRWLWRLQQTWGRECARLSQPNVPTRGSAACLEPQIMPARRRCDNLQVVGSKRNHPCARGKRPKATMMGEAVQWLRHCHVRCE